MMQKNHHFLFAQIHFGSLQDLEEDLAEDAESEIDLKDPWVFVLEANETNRFQQTIGLFINWTDELN